MATKGKGGNKVTPKKVDTSPNGPYGRFNAGPGAFGRADAPFPYDFSKKTKKGK